MSPENVAYADTVMKSLSYRSLAELQYAAQPSLYKASSITRPVTWSTYRINLTIIGLSTTESVINRIADILHLEKIGYTPLQVADLATTEMKRRVDLSIDLSEQADDFVNWTKIEVEGNENWNDKIYIEASELGLRKAVESNDAIWAYLFKEPMFFLRNVNGVSRVLSAWEPLAAPFRRMHVRKVVFVFFTPPRFYGIFELINDKYGMIRYNDDENETDFTVADTKDELFDFVPQDVRQRLGFSRWLAITLENPKLNF